MPSVMVIEHGSARAAELPFALQAEGYELVAILPFSWLRAETTDYAADIAVFLADRLDPALTACIDAFYRRHPRPIALSVPAAAPRMMEEAVRAGVSTIAIGEQLRLRARPILESAVARFEEMRRWRGVGPRETGEGYKVVERAKGILMRRRGLTEALAESVLQTMAAHRATSIAEMAGAIVDAETQLRQQ